MRRFPSRTSRAARGFSLSLVLSCLAPLAPAAPQLAEQPSVFLQAQAQSPVDWMPWGPAAFQRARAEKKPVYVAVGAFASELSRAMGRQSFSNAETAKFLNEHFVCVLVDAKERPDIAALYQNYLQAVKQVSGPPMNVWLTPELKPFEGTNYLPPTEEWGREGFVTIAKRIGAAWTADAAAQERKADEAVAAVVAAQERPAAAPLDAAAIGHFLAEARETWKARFDAANGGFGEPPKYPEPELLQFLLLDPATQPLALTTLRALLHSPMRDPLDGGFFRSGSDPAWRLPYFQKQLADQPRLALALLDALKTGGDPELAAAARGALTYVLERLTLPGGDYAAAEDATGEDLMPSHLWTLAEIRTALGDKEGADFAAAHGVTAEGNLPEDAFPGVDVKGKNLLLRTAPMGAATAEKALSASARQLLQTRDRRPAARRDDAATAGAHGLLLTALARAGAELDDARLRAAAKTEAAFIRQELLDADGRLLRLRGRAAEASPADYALVAAGLATHAAVAGDAEAAKLGQRLLQVAEQRFWHAKAGRYFASAATDDPAFWARVYTPAPVAGEPPTAEPAMLLTLLTLKQSGATSDTLVRTLVEDGRASAEPVRGDVLLALATAAAR